MVGIVDSHSHQGGWGGQGRTSTSWTNIGLDDNIDPTCCEHWVCSRGPLWRSMLGRFITGCSLKQVGSEVSITILWPRCNWSKGWNLRIKIKMLNLIVSIVQALFLWVWCLLRVLRSSCYSVAPRPTKAGDSPWTLTPTWWPIACDRWVQSISEGWIFGTFGNHRGAAHPTHRSVSGVATTKMATTQSMSLCVCKCVRAQISLAV